MISNKTSQQCFQKEQCIYAHIYMPKEFQMVDVIKPKTKLTEIKDDVILEAPEQLELGHEPARRRMWYTRRRRRVS